MKVPIDFMGCTRLGRYGDECWVGGLRGRSECERRPELQPCFLEDELSKGSLLSERSQSKDLHGLLRGH